MLEVHVTDFGKGIRADDIEKIFGLFSKAESSSDMNFDGVGMGLHISRNIVEKNGGYIDVYSGGENQGSTFMFGMKMALCEEESYEQTISQLEVSIQTHMEQDYRQ